MDIKAIVYERRKVETVLDNLILVCRDFFRFTNPTTNMIYATLAGCFLIGLVTLAAAGVGRTLAATGIGLTL